MARYSSLAADLIALAGLALVVYGLSMISVPLALMLAGLCLLGVAFDLVTRTSEKKETAPDGNE